MSKGWDKMVEDLEIGKVRRRQAGNTKVSSDIRIGLFGMGWNGVE